MLYIIFLQESLDPVALKQAHAMATTVMTEAAKEDYDTKQLKYFLYFSLTPTNQ